MGTGDLMGVVTDTLQKLREAGCICPDGPSIHTTNVPRNREERRAQKRGKFPQTRTLMIHTPECVASRPGTRFLGEPNALRGDVT
jgi:hypothetical protein